MILGGRKIEKAGSEVRIIREGTAHLEYIMIGGTLFLFLGDPSEGLFRSQLTPEIINLPTYSA